MPTTAGELRECLNRMLAGDFVTVESPVYLISRDGETLRPIVEMSHRPIKVRFKGEGQVWGHTVTIRGHDPRSPDAEPPTKCLGDLIDLLARSEDGAKVKILCDGFGMVYWDDLESVKLAAEIVSLKFLDLTETSVILCP